MQKNTSWGKVAKWYGSMVENSDSYQNKVILPNLIRVLNLKKNQKVLDLACGSGFFSKEFSKIGAKVTGVDLGEEFIKAAKNQDPHSNYLVGDAENLSFLKSQSFDIITIVLALQNIKNYQAAISECARLLNPEGRLVLVLNHPAFRIPDKSYWFYDDKKRAQFRRIDGYMTEFFKEVNMHPGKKYSPKNLTYSFHRPLQAYFKAFKKAGLVVYGLEEWVSHKSSDSGPRVIAENIARKEIPLFMCLELGMASFKI